MEEAQAGGAQDPKRIYRAASEQDALRGLDGFEARWAAKDALMGKMWRHWAGISPFFAYPDPIWRALYTTNVVESLHMTLRKLSTTRASFTSEEAALKLLYLALQNLARRWQAARDAKTALNHFLLRYGERIEAGWQRPSRS